MTNHYDPNLSDKDYFRARGILGFFCPHTRFHPKPGSASVPLLDGLVISVLVGASGLLLWLTKGVLPFPLLDTETLFAPVTENSPLSYARTGGPGILSFVALCLAFNASFAWIATRILGAIVGEMEDPAERLGLHAGIATITAVVAAFALDVHVQIPTELFGRTFLFVFPILIPLGLDMFIRHWRIQLSIPQILITIALTIPLAFLAPGTLILTAALASVHGRGPRKRHAGIAIAASAGILAAIVMALQGQLQGSLLG